MTTPGCSGLQVEEQSGPDQSLARVGTARAAFVGRTLRGPVDHPILVKSFAEFQHVFGGLWQPSPLGYAVEQFFDNGGREALVVRVANGARSATLTLPAGRHTLTLRALRPGTREFIRASVDYDNAAVSEFNLTLQRVRVQGTEQVEDQEIFPRLALVPGAERYLGRALDDSELVRLVGEVPPQRPDRTLHSGNGLPTGYVYSNADGDDGGPLTDYDLIGSAADHTGLFALDGVDYFNFLCIPQLCRERDVAVSVWLVAVRYCKERRALLFIDPPAGWQTADDALRGMRHWNLASEHAVMYFPRLLVLDKLRGQHQCFAPSAAVAGMLARQDETAPVWSQPRLEDAILRPGYRPACLVSEDKRMRLAMLGVNTVQAVRSATRMGVHARTLAGRNGSADSQCLAVRRFGLFVVNSIERGTRWIAVTQPHRAVAAEADAQVREFLGRLHAEGAFGDVPQEEAFQVHCKGPLADDPGAPGGDVHIVVGYAGTAPGRFHGFRVSHGVRGSRVAPVSLIPPIARLASTPAQPEAARAAMRLSSSAASELAPRG